MTIRQRRGRSKTSLTLAGAWPRGTSQSSQIQLSFILLEDSGQTYCMADTIVFKPGKRNRGDMAVYLCHAQAHGADSADVPVAAMHCAVAQLRVAMPAHVGQPTQCL